MTSLVPLLEHLAMVLVAVSVDVAAGMLLLVLGARLVLSTRDAWNRWVERRYGPVLARALEGDEAALTRLERMPRRYRLTLARTLVLPLIADRDPRRVAAVRRAVRAMALGPYCRGLLGSPFWWRRALALRAVGLLQLQDYLGRVVSALDDPEAEVRNTALDALADLGNPAALVAIVVRLHDSSLLAGRRQAALSAFGAQCEDFLLDLAFADPGRRLDYARALALCGTARSRPVLCDWLADARPDVRAAALEALAHIGLDDAAARLAVASLDSSQPVERVMAAGALQGVAAPGVAESLARLLDDDAWEVAVRAARSLQSLGEAGRPFLDARARSPDLPGVLARQMLWEATIPKPQPERPA
jgi:HEAT repeat protein